MCKISLPGDTGTLERIEGMDENFADLCQESVPQAQDMC